MRPSRRFSEFTDILVVTPFARNSQFLQEELLLFVSRGTELDPEILVPRADMHYSPNVIAESNPIARRKDYCVETSTEFGPVRQDSDEIENIFLLEEVSVSWTRPLSINDRHWLLRVVVVGSTTPVILSLDLAANYFR